MDTAVRPSMQSVRESGISLVELLVAMALFLVVTAAIFGVWSRLQSTYAFTNEDLLAQQQAQAAMNEMVEYIRTARNPSDPPSETLNAAIVSAYPNEITLWTDTDRDPERKHTLELVRFRVDVDSGTRTLWRDTASESYTFPGSSTRLVSTNVANDASKPLFAYAGAGGSPLATDGTTGRVLDPTAIREVRIVLRVDVVQGSSPTEHVITSIVQPRNLRQY